VYLDAVEASLDCIFCRLGIQLDVLFDLCDGKFPGKDVLITGNCRAENLNGTRADNIIAAFLLEDGRARNAAQSPELEEDKRSLCVDGVGDLLSESQPSSQILRDAKGARTAFHPAIWASFQIPGAFMYPPACGAMKVASVTRSVPGTLARCV
jgi:hypothetical protein